MACDKCGLAEPYICEQCENDRADEIERREVKDKRDSYFDQKSWEEKGCYGNYKRSVRQDSR